MNEIEAEVIKPASNSQADEDHYVSLAPYIFLQMHHDDGEEDQQ